MTTLTNLEQQVLTSFNTEYDCAEDEKMDNATYTDMEDIADHTGLSVATIKGVAGSLVKKGLVEIDEGTADAPQCFSLSDEGIDAFYSL